MTKAKLDVVATVKGLVADPKDRIKLDDFVVELLRATIADLSSDEFAASGENLNAETFQTRLHRYEKATRDVLDTAILIARWGNAEQLAILGRVVSHLAAMSKTEGGLVAWVCLKWYPLFLITYAAGIAALSADNPSALKPLLLTPVVNERSAREHLFVASRVADAMDQVEETFKLLPPHGRHYVPRSEYVFGLLKEPIERILFLGDDYERYFDEFEILNALACGDLNHAIYGRVWAQPGRFGYKFARNGQPFDGFVADAIAAGEGWPLLKSGFFQSSAARFKDVADAYRTFLTNLHWY